jgi:hypothetical protein
MKIILTIIAALMLTACAHTQPDIGLAPPAKMPELPQTLREPAHRLPPIVDPSLGGLNESGAETDAAYNALALRYNALLGIYECVRRDLEAKTAETCLK